MSATNKATAALPPSHVWGQGHGDAHNWERCETTVCPCLRGGGPCAAAHEKHTTYRCRVCACEFQHYYDLDADIFEGMRKVGVPSTCTNTSSSS
jgi:hypothetical protein